MRPVSKDEDERDSSDRQAEESHQLEEETDVRHAQRLRKGDQELQTMGRRYTRRDEVRQSIRQTESA